LKSLCKKSGRQQDLQSKETRKSTQENKNTVKTMQELIKKHSFLSKNDEGDWIVTTIYYNAEPVDIPVTSRLTVVTHQIAPQNHFNLTNCKAGQRVIGKVEDGKFDLKGLSYGLSDYSL
jgi:hypothetical protein